jgi:hypothetical protein
MVMVEYNGVKFNEVKMKGTDVSLQFCASENDWYIFLKTALGITQDFDWRGLRVDREKPFNQGMYHQPAGLAEFSPWPLVAMSGTTRGRNWRQAFTDRLWDVEIMSAWGAKIEEDVFQKYHDLLITMLPLIIWGCDVCLYESEGAGKYSHLEVAVARACGIPVYFTEDYTPRQFAEMVRENHFPVSFAPQPNQAVAEMVQGVFLGDSDISSLAERQLRFLERPFSWASLMRPILARRGRVLPWGKKI